MTLTEENAVIIFFNDSFSGLAEYFEDYSSPKFKVLDILSFRSLSSFNLHSSAYKQSL